MRARQARGLPALALCEAWVECLMSPHPARYLPVAAGSSPAVLRLTATSVRRYGSTGSKRTRSMRRGPGLLSASICAVPAAPLPHGPTCGQPWKPSTASEPGSSPTARPRN